MDRVTTGIEFVRTILSELVDNPDELQVSGTIDELGVFISVRTAESDLGRVIGKGGANIEAIRRLMWTLGKKMDAHYNVKVVSE